MIIKNSQIILDSNKHFEIIDITSKINDEINIDKGIVNIFSKHSTSAVVVNENEKGLLDDLMYLLDNLINDKYSWKHDMIDDNAESHLKSFLLSSGETIPVKDYKLDLGIWQSVFFIELDGPRKNRKIDVTIIGE